MKQSPKDDPSASPHSQGMPELRLEPVSPSGPIPNRQVPGLGDKVRCATPPESTPRPGGQLRAAWKVLCSLYTLFSLMALLSLLLGNMVQPKLLLRWLPSLCCFSVFYAVHVAATLVLSFISGLPGGTKKLHSSFRNPESGTHLGWVPSFLCEP